MSKELSLDRSSSIRCVHTKNIYSMLDTPKTDDNYKKLKLHVDSCAICHKELLKFNYKMKVAQVFIPKMIMDRDLRQSFEGEVVELFKAMNMNDRLALRKRVKTSFVNIDKMGIEFFKNLASKSMIKAYFFALVALICLKLFL